MSNGCGTKIFIMSYVLEKMPVANNSKNQQAVAIPQ
jgi:hypothetical protein